jgi:hydroxyacylglutathione hydrolase
VSTLEVLQTGPLGVNTYIVKLCGSVVFIVDSAACTLCGDEYKVTRYLASHNLIPVAVVQTHGHFDHVAGLPALCSGYKNIPVLIHKDDAQMIGPDSARIQSLCLGGMGLEEILPAVSNLPAATGFLEDGKTLADILAPSTEYAAVISDDVLASLAEWAVIHTPGHTPGSVCFYNKKEKLLISGDTVFFHSWGRTDLFGGSESTMHASLVRLSRIIEPDTRVFPGHEMTGFLFSENY